MFQQKSNQVVIPVIKHWAMLPSIMNDIPPARPMSSPKAKVFYFDVVNKEDHKDKYVLRNEIISAIKRSSLWERLIHRVKEALQF